MYVYTVQLIGALLLWNTIGNQRNYIVHTAEKRMRLKNYDWTFASALAPEICKEIIDHGLSQSPKRATTSGGVISDKRDSDVVWLYDPWLFDYILPFVERANREAGWNFQWDPVHMLQFTKYGPGQFYNWHRDTSIRQPDSEGKIRKISVTVNLNDDYEGGEFYIDAENHYGKTSPRLNENLKLPGSIAVFPADIWHKVDPVTKGIRYSLVVWLTGDPFK